ncbi:MAG TPA: LysR family transcriptional regulator [Longimicrobiales bacterium]|nr:LysR family transcriptional regulator [Longimicrobiales bacterium]
MLEFNYRHLAYFRAVAHEGNLTRAADTLHVSQSAVSVQIRKLEKSLGHELFERRNRSLVLTEAGRIALDHADEIFSLGSDLVGTLDETGRARKILRVGSMATLSRNFQLRFLAPLMMRDDVELVVRSGPFSDLYRQLEAHQIDVLLANWTPPRDAGTRWVAHPMARQDVSLIARSNRQATRETDSGSQAKRTAMGKPADLANIPDDATLRDLLSEAPLVLPSAENSMRVGFDALVDRLDIRPQIAAEVDDMAMLRLVAREGIGRAVIPPIVVRDEIASGELVELTHLPGLQETFYAITISRRFPNPLLKELVDEGVAEV